MRRTFYNLVFISLITLSANGQGLDSVALSKSIIEQADTIANILLRKDYKLYVKFIYPELVKQAGGEIAMAKLISNAMKENIESKGYELTSVKFGSPSSIIKNANELQSTLPQIITLSLRSRQFETKSTLIAISTDNGKNWKFLDTSGRSIAEMRRSFPNLS